MPLSEADTGAKIINPTSHSTGWTKNLVRREKTASQIDIPNYSGNRLKSFLFPLPLPKEQKRIAPQLKDQVDYIKKLKADIEKQIETIKASPQDILRKAFSGEL